MLGSSVLSFGGRISPFLPCINKNKKIRLPRNPGFHDKISVVLSKRAELVYYLTFFPVFMKSLQLETWKINWQGINTKQFKLIQRKDNMWNFVIHIMLPHKWGAAKKLKGQKMHGMAYPLFSCSFPLLLMLTLSFPHFFLFFFILLQSTFLFWYLLEKKEKKKTKLMYSFTIEAKENKKYYELLFYPHLHFPPSPFLLC